MFNRGVMGPLRPCDNGVVGLYVYALVDSRDGSVFYIGRGRRQRWASHMREYLAGRESNPKKVRRIAGVLQAGAEVQALCIAENLTEKQTFSLERSLIARLKPSLTNAMPGELTQSEKVSAHLRTLVPYREWLAKKPRDAEDIEMHKLIIMGLLEFCAPEDIHANS